MMDGDFDMSLPADPTNFADYGGPAPILLASTSEQARDRAAQAIAAAGYRIAAVSMDDLPERLEIQASASALWVEIDRDDGASLDRLLDRVQAEADSGRFPAIVAAPSGLIDPVMARLTSRSVELLADASDADRLATLAVATGARHLSDQLHDVASEPNAARLRQLSDEVSRIADTLARLSSGPDDAQPLKARPGVAGESRPDVSPDLISQVIRARRLRSRFFNEELFADPAWDMLLDLLAAEIAQHRVPVSSLCIAAAVPPTTALRWIKTMTEAGLFRRRSDPHDGRRVFVELSREASQAMRRYFAEVGPVAVV
jgi:DNA-binding MarR family transcriptional regulator